MKFWQFWRIGGTVPLILWLTACLGRPPSVPSSSGSPPSSQPRRIYTPSPEPWPSPDTARLPRTRGDYVTGSSAPDAAELAWLSRFRIVHAGGLTDPLPTEAIATLRSAGVQTLLVYDWLPATYHYTDGEPDDPLTQWLYTNRDWATLNPAGPFPHCTEEGYDWCEDYYFDLGNATVRQKRVDYLVQQVRALGYDGLFFDWGNSLFLDDPAFASLRATYEERHPDLPYAQAIALFYQALRDAGLVVQSNQGYREAAVLLPHEDYDTSESAGTTDENRGRRLLVAGRGLISVPDTVYYPNSPDPQHGSLKDTLEVWHWMVAQAQTFGGPDFHGIVHLNYAAPLWAPLPGKSAFYRPQPPRNAIFYNLALARLFGQATYTEVPWAQHLARDEVYFYDLGEPVEATYHPLPGGGYVRYYTHGLVLVGAWQHPVTLTLRDPSLPAAGQVYDAYDRGWLPLAGPHILRLAVTPEPDPVTGNMAPLGRVVIYPEPWGKGLPYWWPRRESGFSRGLPTPCPGRGCWRSAPEAMTRQRVSAWTRPPLLARP